MPRALIALASFVAGFVTLDMIAPDLGFAANFDIPALNLFYLTPLAAAIGAYIILARARRWNKSNRWKAFLFPYVTLVIFLFLVNQIPRWYIDSRIDCINLSESTFAKIHHDSQGIRKSLDFKIALRSNFNGHFICFKKDPGRREIVEKIVAQQQ